MERSKCWCNNRLRYRQLQANLAEKQVVLLMLNILQQLYRRSLQMGYSEVIDQPKFQFTIVWNGSTWGSYCS